MQLCMGNAERAQIIFPQSEHLLWGSTVGYPSDSLASCCTWYSRLSTISTNLSYPYLCLWFRLSIAMNKCLSMFYSDIKIFADRMHCMLLQGWSWWHRHTGSYNGSNVKRPVRDDSRSYQCLVLWVRRSRRRRCFNAVFTRVIVGGRSVVLSRWSDGYAVCHLLWGTCLSGVSAPSGLVQCCRRQHFNAY